MTLDSEDDAREKQDQSFLRNNGKFGICIILSFVEWTLSQSWDTLCKLRVPISGWISIR